MSKAEEILVQLLEKSISALESGVEFLGEQIPLVVQELLLFKVVISTVFFILPALVVAFIVPKLIRKGNKMREESRLSNYEGCWVLAGVLGVLCTVTALVNLYMLLKVTLAPRLYLLEYTADLVR